MLVLATVNDRHIFQIVGRVLGSLAADALCSCVLIMDVFCYVNKSGLMSFTSIIYGRPCVGRRTPLPPLSIFFPFLLFPFFCWLYLFSSFVFLFFQNSPTPFPGRRS